jgi:peptidoglycan hydrolase CwlO-like protein
MDKTVREFLQSAQESLSIQRLFYKLGNVLLKEQELVEKDAEIDRFQGHVKDLESYIQAKEAEIIRFQGHVKDLESYIQAKEAEIIRLCGHVNDIGASLQEKEQKIAGLDDTLRTIYESRGWKFINILYKIKRKMLFSIKNG